MAASDPSSPTLSPTIDSLGDVNPSEVFKMVDDALKGDPSAAELKDLIDKVNEVKIDPRCTAAERKRAQDFLDELDFRYCTITNHSYEPVKTLDFTEANRDAVRKIDILNRLHETDLQIFRDEAHILGQGSFGTVYAGKKNGLPVAIKELNPDTSEDDLIAFMNECQILARVRHPYCCEYIGYLEDPFRIVTRLYPTSLSEIIEDGTLTLADRFQMAFQLASAVWSIHNMGLLHRDLKNENVFVDENKNVRLADFGLTEYAPGLVQDDGSPPGSLLFMAPEIILGKPFNNKSEVFSLGLMFYELFTGRLVFDDVQNKLELINRQKAVPMLPVTAKDYSTKRGDGKTPKEMFDLAAQCYSYEPDKRPELSVVMKRIVDIAVQFFIPKSGTAARFWKMMCCYTFRQRVLLSEVINHLVNVEPEFDCADTFRQAFPPNHELLTIQDFWHLCCWFPNFFFNRTAFGIMEETVRKSWFVVDDRTASLRLKSAKKNAFVIRPSQTDPYHEPFVLCVTLDGTPHNYHIVRHNSSRTVSFSCSLTGPSQFLSISELVKYVQVKLHLTIAPSLSEKGLRDVYE